MAAQEPEVGVVDRHAVEGELPERVVLLGASNVTRSLGTAIAAANRLSDQPLEILAAFGHGRSYGLRMPLLFRELPGIVDCGIWDELARRRGPAAAILTDIGNDLLYDMQPAQIADWVRTCVDRLQAAGARVALTPLPLCSIHTISAARFRIMRHMLFPACRLDLATVTARAHELDHRLRNLAAERGLRIIEHRSEWYGFDPIHIRRRFWSEAWSELFGPWRQPAIAGERQGVSLRRWIYLRTLAPDRRWLFGREYRKPQPAGHMPDGTRLFFY